MVSPYFLGQKVPKENFYSSKRRSVLLILLFIILLPIFGCGILDRLKPNGLIFDFTNNLDQADEVFLTYPDLRKHVAKWKSDQWIYSEEPDWMNPRNWMANFKGQRRDVIFFHPIDNAIHSIEFSHIVIGEYFLLGGGIDDGALKMAKTVDGPIQFRIKVGEFFQKEVVFEIKGGFFEYKINLPKKLRGKVTSVTFEVEGPGYYRNFCFSAKLKYS